MPYEAEGDDVGVREEARKPEKVAWWPTEAAEAVGCTVRELVYWCSTKLIRRECRRGSRMAIHASEMPFLACVAQLRRGGVSLQNIRRKAAEIRDLLASYDEPPIIIWTKGEGLFAAPSITWQGDRDWIIASPSGEVGITSSDSLEG